MTGFGFFDTASHGAKVGVGVLLATFTYIPLAILSSIHAKELFEILPGMLCRRAAKPAQEAKAGAGSTARRAAKIAYWLTMIVVGTLAAADSTKLTHLLLSPTLHGFTYFLDASTQIAMSILRAWSLDNMIQILTAPFAEGLERRLLAPASWRDAVSRRHALLGRLGAAAGKVQGCSDAELEGLRATLDAHRDDPVARFETLLNFGNSGGGDDGAAPSSSRLRTYTRVALCSVAGIVGAIGINGFLPPAVDIGTDINHWFDDAMSPSGANALGNVFAVCIATCLGSLTMWASYVTMAQLLDWVEVHALGRHSDVATPLISKRTAMNVLSILMSAGSSCNAGQLAIRAHGVQTAAGAFVLHTPAGRFYTACAFIGFTLTDYYPMDVFNSYVFDRHSLRTELGGAVQRASAAVAAANYATVDAFLWKLADTPVADNPC